MVAEEPGAQTFTSTLEDFHANIESGRGCIFLAVYRGKVSEGLDFKDDNARAVFCVGIPFPSLGDIKVKLKKEYNSHPMSKAQGMMGGGDWYQHQAGGLLRTSTRPTLNLLQSTRLYEHSNSR